MKKFIFVLFCILTFGLILTPICLARSYTYDDLQINRYYGYVDMNSTSSYNYYYIKINYPTTRISSNNNVLCFEVFNNDLTIPNYGGIISSAYLCAKTVNGYSQTVNLSNTTNATSGAKYFYYSITAQNWNTTSYEYLQIGCPSSIDLNDYSVQLCFIANSTGYLPFTPNSYYQINSTMYYGVVSDFDVYSIYQYTSETTNINDLAKFYNVISLKNCNFIWENNNNDTYQYSIKIDINERIGNLPSFKCTYLEINYITINNTRYSYTNACNNFSWLNNNIHLYTTEANLINDYETASDYYINSIEFRIADYEFKSSSYYNSTLGIEGYIKNTRFYVSDITESDLLNAWWKDGFESGQKSGYDNGYQDGYTLGHDSSTFGDLIFSVGDIPIRIISSLLNFEILGTNLMSLFTAIISLFLFIWLIRRFKE